jgi:hypothetical protein
LAVEGELDSEALRGLGGTTDIGLAKPSRAEGKLCLSMVRRLETNQSLGISSVMELGTARRVTDLKTIRQISHNPKTKHAPLALQ